MDHPYATRIRQNITLKYTSKFIDNVVPPHNYPPFPPPHVQLHPDDLNNKVFLAVARSFLTVDNRAMTIKDIAERACRYGLVCQNLSAAAQAITTYLRAHKSRCDKQQDQPLLLSHTLSGTISDDDLVPALHSRSGGDSHPTENRLTNFRKGTAVWYLSRATGAPCPFSRAGIRLCDYIDPDAQDPVKDQLSSNKKRPVERCGEKRKRPLRGCVARGSGSDNERPAKVKLTLRLKPLAVKPSTSERSSSACSVDPEKEDDSDAYESSSDEDSMSVDYSDDESQTAQMNKDEEPWSLPPYPRRSISIPCYTPLQGYYPSYPPPSQYRDPYRRSPSIAYSIATPPPDSEDEADDFHITMSRVKDYTCHSSRNLDADIGWDAELDSEGDGETMWESPGPRSPSAPIMQSSEVTVKEEPRDVQGMLDAWDDFDSTIADARVAEVIAKAVFDIDGKAKVKLEAVDPWDWDSSTRFNSDWPSEETAQIKQEDFGIDSLFPPSVPGPSSPLSPIPHSSHFSFLSSPNNSDLEALASHEHSEQKYATVRPRAKTVPVPSAFFQAVIPKPVSSFSLSPPLTSHRLSTAPSDTSSHDSSVPSTTLVKLLQSMSVITAPSNSISSSSYAISPPTPCISPLQTRCQSFPTAPKVVVHTCQPCNPAISATQIEDISVYQMMLGAFQLLRRIDTDFVNLSPIVAYSGSPHPVLSTIANATIVTKGSPEVSGTWVPLPAAQVYVKEHLAGDLALDIFLSDALVERFPSALQDFYRSNAPARSLNQFGKPFESTLQAAKLEVQTDNGTPVCWDSRFGWMHSESSGSSNTSASAPFTLTAALAVGGKQAEHVEDPLSATEQEIFQELCVIPDWDKELLEGGEDTISLCVDSKPAHVETSTPAPAQPEQCDRPLRRSKRVADALAAAQQAPPQPSRTRSRKAGSRNSLS